jgi:hypothetical protein
MPEPSVPIATRPTMVGPNVTTASFALAIVTAAMSVVTYIITQAEYRRTEMLAWMLLVAGVFGVLSTVRWARYFRDYIDFAASGRRRTPAANSQELDAPCEQKCSA